MGLAKSGDTYKMSVFTDDLCKTPAADGFTVTFATLADFKKFGKPECTAAKVMKDNTAVYLKLDKACGKIAGATQAVGSGTKDGGTKDKTTKKDTTNKTNTSKQTKGSDVGAAVAAKFCASIATVIAAVF